MTKQINPFQSKAGMTVIKSVRKDADVTIINKNNSFSTCKSKKTQSIYSDSNRSIAQNMSDVLRQSLKK
jgi:hypothetical protein